MSVYDETTISHDESRRPGNGPEALGISLKMFPGRNKALEIDRYKRRYVSSGWLQHEAITMGVNEARRAKGLPKLAGQELFDAVRSLRKERVDKETGEIRVRYPRASEPDWVRPYRVARCSWRASSRVGLQAGYEGAYYIGVETCGSVWSCPVCSASIRSGRAREISQAVETHQAQGGSVLFVTVTLRHRQNQPLQQTIETALSGWRKRVVSGRRWMDDQAKYGISGQIRSLEVTLGQNGWHPHIHALFFIDKQDVTPEEIKAIGDRIHQRWADYAEAQTGMRPTREHGTDVQAVDQDGKVLAQYLAKMQDNGSRWGVGAEMSRSDAKSGRVGGSITPFQLLDELDHIEETDRRRLWVEYFHATFGRQAITWSRGLKKRFGIGAKTDDEVLEVEQDKVTMTGAYDFPTGVYDDVRRHRHTDLAVALQFAQIGNRSMVEYLLPGGDWIEPPPLQPDFPAAAIPAQRD